MSMYIDKVWIKVILFLSLKKVSFEKINGLIFYWRDIGNKLQLYHL